MAPWPTTGLKDELAGVGHPDEQVGAGLGLRQGRILGRRKTRQVTRAGSGVLSRGKAHPPSRAQRPAQLGSVPGAAQGPRGQQGGGGSVPQKEPLLLETRQVAVQAVVEARLALPRIWACLLFFSFQLMMVPPPCPFLMVLPLFGGFLGEPTRETSHPFDMRGGPPGDPGDRQPGPSGAAGAGAVPGPKLTGADGQAARGSAPVKGRQTFSRWFRCRVIEKSQSFR